MDNPQGEDGYIVFSGDGGIDSFHQKEWDANRRAYEMCAPATLPDLPRSNPVYVIKTMRFSPRSP